MEFNRHHFARFAGAEKGPTSVVLAGVHGNERAGINAFARVVPNLQIDNGVVWFGYGNVRGTLAGTRDSQGNYGNNLNRMWLPKTELSPQQRKSYEFKRSRIIDRYMHQSTALLDIHGTINPGTIPHIICEPNGYNIARFFPVDLVLSGLDEHEPGGTDYGMNMLGGIGLCLEAGFNLDPEASDIAEQGIYAFLAARGHIQRQLVARQQRRLAVYETYKTQTDSFFLQGQWADFSPVEKDTLIGTDGDKEVRVKEPSYILYAESPELEKAGEEAFLLARAV